MTLTLPKNLEPVEVHADSLLAYFTEDHATLAVVCLPNTRRTFQTGHPDATACERTLVVLSGGTETQKRFLCEEFAAVGQPVNVKGARSWNLRLASRDLVYHFMVYSNSPFSGRISNDHPDKETDAHQARLESLLPLIAFEDGVEPAISEGAYRTRLQVAGIVLLMITGGVGALIIRLFRKRNGTAPKKSDQT